MTRFRRVRPWLALVALWMLATSCASRREVEGMLSDVQQMRSALDRIEQTQAAQDSLLLDRTEFINGRITEGETFQRRNKADQMESLGEMRQLMASLSVSLQEGQQFSRSLSHRLEELTVLLAQSGVKQMRDSLVNADPEWLYNQATLDLYRGFPELSRLGLREYLHRFPKGPRVEYAHYWLAETWLSEQNPDSALVALDAFLGDYPNSSKRPAAQVRKALLVASLGDGATAETLLEEVLQRWPQSAEARIARQRLEEGNLYQVVPDSLKAPQDPVEKKGLIRETDSKSKGRKAR
ncbi:MAG: tetratricopeptide repeat protein [Candidatus Cloacimonetes bacterium]|nr:tetratricopeptide repeat protein [Candidatus Cloacimonadota bacterium]